MNFFSASAWESMMPRTLMLDQHGRRLRSAGWIDVLYSSSTNALASAKSHIKRPKKIQHYNPWSYGEQWHSSLIRPTGSSTESATFAELVCFSMGVNPWHDPSLYFVCLDGNVEWRVEKMVDCCYYTCNTVYDMRYDVIWRGHLLYVWQRRYNTVFQNSNC